jgi:hypothetical protein
MIERRYGTKLDWGAVFRYLAWVCVRSGRRQEGLRYFARAAVRGEGRSVATDLSGLLRDRLPPPRLRHTRPNEHRTWTAEAEAWLTSLRS